VVPHPEGNATFLGVASAFAGLVGGIVVKGIHELCANAVAIHADLHVLSFNVTIDGGQVARCSAQVVPSVTRYAHASSVHKTSRPGCRYAVRARTDFFSSIDHVGPRRLDARVTRGPCTAVAPVFAVGVVPHPEGNATFLGVASAFAGLVGGIVVKGIHELGAHAVAIRADLHVLSSPRAKVVLAQDEGR